MYLLAANLGEIGLLAGTSLLGKPLPLSAVQILYVNLATDGLPAIALSLDPPESDLMRRPPRSRRTGIFTSPVVTLWEITMLVLVTSVPFLQDAFGTTSLSAHEWLRAVALAFLIVPVLGTTKLLIRRGRLGLTQSA